MGAFFTPTTKTTPKEGLPSSFKCKFLLAHYYHVLLQQIIKHMWLVGSTMGLFYFDCMLFSVLWLRAVLAAGFVPKKQHGSFVMEKWHMLGFFLIQQTLKTFRELVQLMWIETLLPRRKNSLRNAVKKFCPMRNSRCWYLCPN